MGWTPETGLNAQHLTAAIRNRVKRLRSVKLGETFIEGLESGEFGFTVVSKDGAELLVRVKEIKEPTRQEEPGKHTPATLAYKRAYMKAQRHQEQIAKAAFAASERRRRRFLGEI